MISAVRVRFLAGLAAVAALGAPAGAAHAWGATGHRIIGRLGVFFTASPRHADVLLVTGAGARGMSGPLRATYDGMPDPKVVIAVGTDAVSGGLLSQSETVTAGVAATVPVDVFLPGSPPSPFSILNALLIAVGQLAYGGKGVR